MATTIITKNGSGAPLAGDLTAGELAVDLTNKRLYSKDSGGTVIELGTTPSAISGGTIDNTVIGGTTAAAGTFTDLTVSGDLTVDTDTLYVDSTNNRVGIGESSPEAPLHISNGGIQLADQSQIGLDLYHTVSSIPSSQNHGYIATANNLAGGVNGDLLIAPRTSAGASIRFITGASPSEKVRIDSNGNLQVTGTLGNATLEGNGSVLEFSRDGANYIGARGGSSSLLIFQTGGATERMRLDASGNLLVGTTAPLYTARHTVYNDYSNVGLFVANQTGTAVGRPVIRCYHAESSGATYARMVEFIASNTAIAGYIQSNGTTTQYVTSSDVRLKENIVDAPAGNIDAIRVRSFDWKADGSHQTYGMVAQELVEVAPEAVSQAQTDDDIWGVDYSKLVPMMIKEIQDLKAEVAALKGAN